MSQLTRGQVAKAAAVNIETLRYYGRRGLIPEPPRGRSGYRQYPADTVARVQFIKRAQDLGFSLKEIAELLSLRMDVDTTCGDIKKRAEGKIADVEARIRSLREVKRALTQLVAACAEGGPVGDCPILGELNGR